MFLRISQGLFSLDASFTAKMTKFDFGWDFAPDPTGSSPQPLAGIVVPLCGGEGKGCKGEEEGGKETVERK